ncbi:MAG: hypothetical protein QNK37_35230 [Acidobacteriota bacterium]|nr:hypothetical protein [Acidobacteriota bacterium]
MSFVSKGALLLLLISPVHGAYPITDVVDLPIDLVDTLEKVEKLQNEYRKFQVYQDQLAHYYRQARKLKDAYDAVSTLRLSRFERILANEVFQSIMDLDADDQDLRIWLELADGAADLRAKLGVFQSRFKNVFQDPVSVDAWQVGAFQIAEDLKADGLRLFEAQHQHQKAALLQAWAHVAEGKHAHEVEGDKFSRVMDLWASFQNDNKDLSGRQRGLDSANANTYALKEAQLKRMRALQGIITMVSLENSRRSYALQEGAKQSLALLDALTQAADNWVAVHDQAVR